jgi:hypothetical protein
MKNRNIILGTILIVCAIFTTTIIISCNKKSTNPIGATTTTVSHPKTRSDNYSELGLDITQHYVTIASVSDIHDILHTTFVQSKLATWGFTINHDSTMVKLVDENSGTYAYTINLYTGSASIYAGLVITRFTESNKIFSVYLAKAVTVDETTTTSLTSLSSGINYLDTGDDVPKSLQWWKDCLGAAMASLLTGGSTLSNIAMTILCADQPEACLAACVIHCTVAGMYPHTMTDYELYTWLCTNYYIDCDKTVYESTFTFSSI